MAKYESATQVQRCLKVEGLQEIPSRPAIYDLYEKFKEFGTVLDLPKSGRSKIIDEKSTIPILDILEKEPTSTLAMINEQTKLSRSTISRRISADIGMYPYKIQTHQELYEDDLDRRVETAQTLLPLLQDPVNQGFIYCSDECTFYVSGYVNKQNSRYWDYEKPDIVQQVPLHSPKVNVWCAISSKSIIGPYFFEEDTVNGQNYLEMLERFFYPALQRMRIARKIYFQQDGAPPHYQLDVRRWLNEKFPGKWIGRRGSIEWAPRSPDLTPCDFFLWGYLKDTVFKKPIKDLDHLRRRITEEVETIDQSMLEKVFLNMEKRLNLVISSGGCHIEHVL